MHSGKPPSIRDLQRHLGYRSPRAAAYVLERLETKGYINRPRRGELTVLEDIVDNEENAQTVSIPLVGSAPCGTPVLADENVEAMIPVSARLLKSGQRYFMLRAIGDSMNQVGIEDRELVLVEQQPTAQDRNIVVAIVDGEATIKEFHRQLTKIVLHPRSSNPIHQPIVLTQDFRIAGIVKHVIKNR